MAMCDRDITLDGAAAGPRRRCFVTRRTGGKDALIRFVVGPGGVVHPDLAAALPGRGLWLSADRDVVNTACARNLFAKGFCAAVVVDDDLCDRVEGLVAKRCLDLLGLARRAGAAAAGFERVRELLASDGAAVLVFARDAADGRRRLERLAAGVPVVTLFSAAELARALGREHVVYVALAKGRVAARFAAEAGRLAGFRRAAETRPSGESREELVEVR